MVYYYAVDIKLFDYHLPPELIAQFPAKRRDDSRLMVLDRTTGELEIRPFKSIVNYLHKGDALVINNTRVFKARLIGTRKTGGKVEVFLVKALPANTTGGKKGLRPWEGMVHPSGRVKEREEILFGKNYKLKLEKRLDSGRWLVSFLSKGVERAIIGKYGHTPLPPYIGRADVARDATRYQTVFARKDKAQAVAAPTAGLHFTKDLLRKIRAKGVKIVEITLDVGPGTFMPVKSHDIEEHKIEPEFASLSVRAAATLNKVRKEGGKVFAVGTTSVRTLESAAINSGTINPFTNEIDLYIKPGHEFRVVDSLLTNFHLPRSSLLILISALAGRERIIKVYEEAIKNNMRFYSYGDAMLIL